MAEVIQGMKAMERKLNQLRTQAAPKAASAGMRAMAVPLKKALRQQVNGVSMSPQLKKVSRASVGSSVKKLQDGYRLKVGFGVGKRTKAKKAKTANRSRSSRPGVGISSANIHWLVFGTGKMSQLAGTTFRIGSGKARASRATGGSRERKSGASTGSTFPYLAGLLKVAIITGTPGAVLAAANKVKTILQKEARKRR